MALIKCSECGKEISDKAKSCPNCGCPIDILKNSEWTPQNQGKVVRINGVNINLDSYWEKTHNRTKMVTEICKATNEAPKIVTPIVIDFLKERNYENDSVSTGCLVVIAFFVLGCMFIGQIMEGVGDTSTEEITEASTEAVTTEENTTEETTEININELKEQATEVTWDELYRNPETWRDKYVKITVNVDEYEAKALGLIDTYICNVDGNIIYILDKRDKKEPTIASGDTAIIYGEGGGMATYKVKTKNAYGATIDKEESKYPQVNMYSAELK